MNSSKFIGRDLHTAHADFPIMPTTNGRQRLEGLARFCISRAKRGRGTQEGTCSALPELNPRMSRERPLGSLDLSEGAVEVGRDVFYIFDADGDANHLVGYADLLSDGRGHRGVRHRGRMRD